MIFRQILQTVLQLHLIGLNNHTNTHLPSAFTYLNNRYQTQNSKFWRFNTKYIKSF